VRKIIMAAGALAMVLAVSACEPHAASPSRPNTSTERRATPAPAPDPSAPGVEKAKNTPGAALLQLSWDGPVERYFTVLYQAGNKDTLHTLRWAPYQDDKGRWKGLFQLAVTPITSGDVVKISVSPIGDQRGLVTVAIYYLGVDLCANVPGSHALSGSAGCTVIIP